MTIFAVLMSRPQPGLVEVIKLRIAEPNRRQVNETQWLIASTKTVVELTAQLGIYDEANPSAPPTGNAIVFATTAYFGRAPLETWDWIRARIEAVADG